MHAGAYFYFVATIGLAILATMVVAFSVGLSWAFFCVLAQRAELMCSFTGLGSGVGRHNLHVQT